MLCNLKEAARIAIAENSGLPAFNVFGYEDAAAVISAAERMNRPVVLMTNKVAVAHMGIPVLAGMLLEMARRSEVPTCVHLDHATELADIRQAVDSGYTSVMIDGSQLPFDENVAVTRAAVEIARPRGVSVEAEIGIVTGHEGKEFHIEEPGAAYTDPELAARFVKDTGIDALVASVGTVHGFYATKPKLDFERIEKIKELTGLPLVMHGGSGISVEDTQRAIRCGIRKINYFSYMSNAGVRAVKELLAEKDVKYFHDRAGAAVDGMEKDVLSAMGMFALE